VWDFVSREHQEDGLAGETASVGRKVVECGVAV
jgi:hypothetical protein